MSYDVTKTRVVLSVEACSFIQRITGNSPSSGLSARMPFGAITRCYIMRSSCILMRWPYGLDIGPSGLGDLGKVHGLVPYEY